MMTEQELAEMRQRREEERERSYRYAMRRTSHKRWQRAREWNGGWENPVPEGAPVSIWRKGHGSWNYHQHADRVDWTQVRAYRLEHGTPYRETIPSPISIPAGLAGTLPPALQFRLDRIDAALERLLAPQEVTAKMIEAGREQAVLQCVRVEDFQLARIYRAMLASVGRNPEGEDREDGLRAEHEHAVPEGQTPARSRQSNKPGREM